jgi:hypothetical protein
MTGEGGETHLRQLAEAELRRAAAPGALGLGHAGSLPLVVQALIAVGAVEVSAADEIQAGLDLALAARRPAVAGASPQWPGRLTRIRLPAGRHRDGRRVAAGIMAGRSGRPGDPDPR